MPSLKTFAFLNTALFALGALNYSIYNISPLLCIPLYALKTIALPVILTRIHKNEPYISKPSSDNLRTRYVLQSTFMDFLTVHLLHNLVRTHESPLLTFLYFIPLSFVYELVFDFFHYVTHRFIHQNPCLYRWIHKTHHQSRHINAYTTLIQHPADLLITNVLPLCLASLLIPTSSLFIHIYMYYKSVVEVGGHIGRRSKTPCFPQFVWIPLCTGITLYAHDHACHHAFPHTNYSKRFALWDKLFGTYRVTALPK
jgi:sterol desaturase/sphingolipid hydroxylase (fatty acid hydroxylase superfamily)